MPESKNDVTAVAVSPDGKELIIRTYYDGWLRLPRDGSRQPVLIAGVLPPDKDARSWQLRWL